MVENDKRYGECKDNLDECFFTKNKKMTHYFDAGR